MIENIEYIAKLAKIKLSPDLVKILSQDLKRILEYIAILNELDTTQIPPTTHAIENKNVFRDDKSASSLDREEILKIAPNRKDNFFKVPKIIE